MVGPENKEAFFAYAKATKKMFRAKERVVALECPPTELGSQFKVRVRKKGHLALPEDLHCFKVGEVEKEFQLMFQHMNRAFEFMVKIGKEQMHIMRLQDAVENALCIVFVKEYFERALISTYPSPMDPSKALCYLVDKGDFALVPLPRIYYMLRKYAQLPFSILKVKLLGWDTYRGTGILNYIIQYQLDLECELSLKLMSQDAFGISVQATLESPYYEGRCLCTLILKQLKEFFLPKPITLQEIHPDDFVLQIFSSLVHVPEGGTNWGTKRHPVTTLSKGVMIEVEVTEVCEPGYFVIQPPATNHLWGKPSGFISTEIGRNYNLPYVKIADFNLCGCLLDGCFFAYMKDGEGAGVRCRLKDRKVKEAPEEFHYSKNRTVEVHLIDRARNAVVPVVHLRPLPPAAAAKPPQAALAYWDTSGINYLLHFQLLLTHKVYVYISNAAFNWF